MVRKKSERMYQFSREQRNPQVGCGFDCVYCAFRKITQRFGVCPDCKSFTPHYHLERFEKGPKKTDGKEFISLCLNGDISFASGEFILRVIKYCEQWHDKTFLIHSKNPAKLLDIKFPYNVVLSITIKTDYRSISKDNIPYSLISKAPHPEDRHLAIRKVQKNDKHITIEPVMDFYPNKLVCWMKNIPWLKVINIGYDSRSELNHLPGPSLEKTLALIERLKGFKEVQTSG